MTTLTKSMVAALRYYVGNPTAYPGMPIDKKAYCTLNTLFYGDTMSERARIKEGRVINPEFFTDKSLVCSFIHDLISATLYGGKGESKKTLYRVARVSDVDAMIRNSKTLSFTSTSKNGFLKDYSDKDGIVLLELHVPSDAPQADIAKLIPDYDKCEEAEVLLPPWLPVVFSECKLSADEMQIKDCLGNPPVKKYLVIAGEHLEPVERSNASFSTKNNTSAGIRVINALLNRLEPNKNDEADYISWKESLISEVVMKLSYRNLYEALTEKMKSSEYVTEMVISDLFDPMQCRAWIKAMIGITEDSSFSHRIDDLQDERVVHTVATYLLGSYLRDELRLGFNSLPRIFSRNNKVGDPFPFFWTLICLGHDIGYLYESNKSLDFKQLRELNELYSLLKLSNDKYLLSLGHDDLKYFGLTDAECEWAEMSIKLAKKYYRFRLVPSPFQCVDHGIAGAVILFDEFLNMAKGTSHKKDIHRKSFTDSNISTGFAAVNNQHSRFLACGILVSLTVARHNMWVVDKNSTNEKEKERCQDYYNAGLTELMIDGEDNKLSIKEPIDQLLYFLDYLDTIDPIKAIYLRHYYDKDGKLCNWIEYLKTGVQIGCQRGKAGSEHIIRLGFDITGRIIDSKGTINSFSNSVSHIGDWLKVGNTPTYTDKEINLYLPVIERKRVNIYPYGVTNSEIADLCFYEGIPDSSRPGLFYSLPNAYQTLNLLMMNGLDGEKIRIFEEGQKPNSIYIKYWEKTVELFINTFSAQCKYSKNSTNLVKKLFRMDRLINANQMIERKKTIAYTSTTKAELLTSFIVEKKDPVIETLHLYKRVPMFDYQDVLGDDYAYTDEEEVLLPPFLSISRNEFGPNRIVEISDEYVAKTLDLDFEEMRFDPYSENQKEEYRDNLNRYLDQAIKTLDSFVKNPDILPKATEEDFQEYINWKKAFKGLINIELYGIYSSIPVNNTTSEDK